MDLGRAERDQAFHLGGLFGGVEVEVEAGRDLQGGAHLVEREVRADPVRRAEENEVVALSIVAADLT